MSRTLDSGAAPRLIVSGVTRTLGGRRVLNDVSLRVMPGTVTSLVGPNGAGKSTLLRVVLGLERVDAGAVSIDGVSYTHLQSPMRSVGASLDAGWLHPRRRARDELLVAARSHRIDKARVTEVLAEVGLAEAARRRVGTLSFGMRQRLSLARALLGRPSLLILDEPLNGLDVDGIRWMRSLVRGIADKGGAVLMSSHVLSEVAAVSDDVEVMSAGRIVTTRSPARTSGSSTSEAAGWTVTALTDAAADLAALLRRQGHVVSVDGRRVVVHDARVAAIARVAFVERLFVESIGETRGDLEAEYALAMGRANQDDIAPSAFHQG